MRTFRVGAIGLLTGLAALPAGAERTETLFEFRNWVVKGVTTDDNTFVCNATVTLSGDSFSIRPLLGQTVRLEFHSQDWEFGEGDTADIQVEVDRFPARDFVGATLLQSSVFVDLPDPTDGQSFLAEVAAGTRLILRSAAGTDVRTYSLFGSAAAIQQLVDCAALPVPDRNPFN